jgi:hypothetical protein
MMVHVVITPRAEVTPKHFDRGDLCPQLVRELGTCRRSVAHRAAHAGTPRWLRDTDSLKIYFAHRASWYMRSLPSAPRRNTTRIPQHAWHTYRLIFQ